MRARALAFAVVALLAMVTSPGWAVAQEFGAQLIARDKLTIGTSGAAPPFSMTGPTGALEGFDIDIGNLLARTLGLRAQFMQLDFAGLLPGLSAGRFDIIASGMTRTPERVASTSFFILSPYIVNGAAITHRAAETGFTDLQSFCGRTMGAVRGGAFQRVAMATFPPGCVTSVREYPGSTELFLDLQNRRIDFVVHDFLGPSYLRSQGRIPGTVTRDALLSVVTQSVVVGARNRPLADAIDAHLDRWRGDGTLDGLVRKWFGVSVDFSRARE